jgi:hypothetical protein
MKKPGVLRRVLVLPVETDEYALNILSSFSRVGSPRLSVLSMGSKRPKSRRA